MTPYDLDGIQTSLQAKQHQVVAFLADAPTEKQ